MMLVLERFPQIGTIRDYMELPPGERAIYNQYTLFALQREAKQRASQVIRFGGKKRVPVPN